ncbi:hypothetical protein MPSEU_000938800 [Mayamaea pseudoterrestris]|nr:hypothetical protein MPSEU_000938800 [Mayamaea pseudoterrestris]
MDSLVGDTGLPSVTIQVKHGNSEQQQQRHSTAAFSTAVETTKPPHEAHRGMTRSELRIEREHRYFVEALTQAGWNDDEELVRTNKCIGLLEAILHPDNERRHNGGSMVYDMRRAKVSEREEDNYMDSPPLSAPLVANDWQRMPIVIPIGSYRLGAQLPCSVLDILVLAPERYSRETYFIFVSHILQKQPKSIIQQVHPISDVYVPVIKFIICGISVDMFIAKGNAAKMKEFVNKRQAERSSVESGLHTLPQRVYLIDDDDYLADDQDEFGIRSLNGVRVAQEILTLVPHLRTFQIVLVSVKKFAMANGIYSNVLGFLGGISYAIMVAYICIDSNSKTSESPVDMLEAFFETFAAWDWSKPVILGELQSIPSSSDIPTLASWNATLNESDRRHLMPIITPAYPSMNSAYNVET